MATILCIDNELLVRHDIAEDLRETGYRVLEADDGRQGLEMVLYHQPDLIVCDIIMPRMDGYELLRELRERYSQQKQIPFIFLTGLKENYQIASGLSFGAQNYLTKPVSFRLLRTTVAARLNQSIH